jgi:hypothetical protein
MNDLSKGESCVHSTPTKIIRTTPDGYNESTLGMTLSAFGELTAPRALRIRSRPTMHINQKMQKKH